LNLHGLKYLHFKFHKNPLANNRDIRLESLYFLTVESKVALFLPWEKSVANSTFYVNLTPLGKKAQPTQPSMIHIYFIFFLHEAEFVARGRSPRVPQSTQGKNHALHSLDLQFSLKKDNRAVREFTKFSHLFLGPIDLMGIRLFFRITLKIKSTLVS
jgi:hypothetical protein